jgi:hypothetical protein
VHKGRNWLRYLQLGGIPNLGEIRDLTGLGPGYSSLGIIAPFDPFQLG